MGGPEPAGQSRIEASHRDHREGIEETTRTRTAPAEWIAAAEAAIELYAGHPAVAFSDLAAEVATEVRLLRAIEAELASHAAERENVYRWVDPAGLARSLPGLAHVGGPAVVAAMGDPKRFDKAKQFKAFTGLVPRASETGDTDRKGQPMSKAGSSLLCLTGLSHRPRPQTRPPARPDLPRANGRAWQRPPRRPLRSCCPPRRTHLDRDAPPDALRDL